MGYVTLNAYDATLRIPGFMGMYQAGDGYGADPRYAVECKNVLTREGYLRPVAKCEQLLPSLPAPIETFARLHRRWYVGDAGHDVLIAASGGKLYWILPTGTEWAEIDMPTGWSGAAYQSNEWSYVAYEMNPVGSESPVDVLLMSNAKDGMVAIRGDDMTASAVTTPKKFGMITRHAERIWGGAIDDDPDMLVYSAPFDPFDWEQNSEIPEDGAGDVMQPSWDGDSFTALTSFGSQLIALKRTKVWRILGTNPGEYTFKEQYGGGTSYAKTVAVDGARILMLGRNGLMQYDGENVASYQQAYAKDVFRRMNVDGLSGATACLYGDVYYLALPLDESTSNNAVLMYDTRDGTWLLRDDVSVEAFLPTESGLYFTSATTPGKVWQWRNDCEASGDAQPVRWVSPWFDFGYKSIVKGGYTLYLTVDCAAAITLNLSIQTEKKTKTKTVSFSAPTNGKKAKQRRVLFGGSGRRFRLIIESTTEEPWQIVGGMQLIAEIDSD